jgi:hypothetical protein
MPFMTNGKRDYKKELSWEKEKKPAVSIDVNNGIASKWKMRNR